MLETAVRAISAPTWFSLVRISVRDLVADGKSLVRNSGVGGGGENRILIFYREMDCPVRFHREMDCPVQWSLATPSALESQSRASAQ